MCVPEGRLGEFSFFDLKKYFLKCVERNGICVIFVNKCFKRGIIVALVKKCVNL